MTCIRNETEDPMLMVNDLFSLVDREEFELFDGLELPWDPLYRIPDLITKFVGSRQTIKGEVMDGAALSDRPIFIGEGARIEPGAYVMGPAYIGPGSVVRHGAYIRSNCLIFQGCIVGHASEIKNSIMLRGAKAPHFAYVGDSILGHRVNLGAGTKLSNLPITSGFGQRPSIKISIEAGVVDTGLTKLGAILGDDVETGCNVVLSPGVVIGQRSLVYPGVSLAKGLYDADMIIKLRQECPTAVRVELSRKNDEDEGVSSGF